MASLNFSYIDASPHSVRPSPMSDPVSPTYTSYSAPSPFSSGSSASYPNLSPVSEPFDTVADSHHCQTANTMEDYTAGYAPPSGSQPIYNDLDYITPQDFEYNMDNWSASELAITVKGQPPPPPPSQQFHQHPPYRTVRSEDLPNEVERMKNLALYIPPSPTTFHHHQQPSPVLIHSPVPVVPSNVPPHHSPSLADHPPHTSVQQPRRIQVQTQFLDVEVDSKWRTGPSTIHHTPYPPTYAHSHSHSVSVGQSYPPVHGDPSQAPTMRRAVSDYSSHVSSSGLRIKQEDTDMYSGLGPYGGQHTHSPQTHIFDLSVPVKPPFPGQPPPVQAPPLSPTYYSRRQPDQLNQPHQPPQQTYAIQPAELSPVEPHPVFDASSLDVGYTAEVTYEQAGYASDSGYVEVCNPQFVSGVDGSEKVEIVHSERGSDVDDSWDARHRCLEHEYTEVATEAADADADGEDDVEDSYSHTGYAPPPQQQHQLADTASQRGVSPGSREEQKARPDNTQGDDGDDNDESPESEDDDSHDPEFVLRRPRRHTSTSYSYTEGRNLRSTRYNPYPSASLTARYSDGHQSQPPSQNEYASQHIRPRRSYSHTSLSPSPSEHYAPLSQGTNMPRRRSRPCATLPIPVPVPNLTKKSRGRRVPTMEDFQGEDGAAQPPAAKSAGGSRKKGAAAAAAKGMRTYTCDVDGCGKLFARGEHLKRHIRSIHTYEKPHRCPYPGCGKDFSRHDNLGQHMRVHKDYVPPDKA
ncbi:putative zinc finger, C2H2 type [Lyophyllum shimeji]|uniref:Zinc finger, C2H2 type n=1 Tax=Lyophyllum shimeji TaxID=47721 RepID=A0A9P3PVG4_LYOSH|nr:putative zinc finger, C2H2 type [Lyophyllum shimeji]